jgi:hypothetical protein
MMKQILLVLTLVAGAFACSVPEADDFDLWTRSYLLPMEKDEQKAEETSDSMTIRVTPGEYEPAVFAIRPRLGQQVSATISVKGMGGTPLPEDWISIRRVVSLNESSRLNRLVETSDPELLKPDMTQFFWITVRPPKDAPAGKYEAQILARSESGSRSLTLACEVLPFSLQDSPIKGGAFMWLIDLPPGWYQDMKEHGLDAIQFFTWEWDIREAEIDRSKWSWEPAPIKIRRQGNGISLDFAEMDRIMAEISSAGMRGPVVVSLGNDHHLFYECRIASEMDWPIETSQEVDGKAVIAPPVNPKLDRLYVDGLRQLREHWEKKAYPQELIILIYDEPTERLLERCKSRYDLLKKAMPETRVYGVVMNRREWAESMLDQMDIIVANGDFVANRDLAREEGKGYFVYSGPLGSVARSRYSMGCLPWSVDAEGVFFWMYNYWFYNPDGCAVYMDADEPNQLVPSTSWEALREGMDDLRYFATARHLLEKAPPEKKSVALDRLQKLKSSLDPNHGRLFRRRGGQEVTTEDLVKAQRVREEAISIILSLE